MPLVSARPPTPTDHFRRGAQRVSPRRTLSRYISSMRTLEIHVSEEVAARVEAAAQSRGVSIEELIQSSVEEKLARDAQFEKAANRVLAKNAELYERLS